MSGRLRVYKKIVLILTVAIIWPVFLVNNTYAYERDTHSRITQHSIELFAKNSGKELSDKLIEQLIKGSQDEDEFPRFLNHFYDPVHERGLTFGNYSWLSAKKWAQDAKSQLAFSYRSILARIFNIDVSEDVDFTWQKAIEYYQRGEKERAFYTLGHVLHLLQDVSVPDHTRNDPHPGNGPFENFALSRKINQGSRIIFLNDLDDYFNELAIYSNNNFYSKDTIDSKEYDLPKADYERLHDDGFRYGMKIDEFGEYFLYQNFKTDLLLRDKDSKYIQEPRVLEGYWSRLSKKSVEYGAGVLHLFLEEIGELENPAFAPLAGGFSGQGREVKISIPSSRHEQEEESPSPEAPALRQGGSADQGKIVINLGIGGVSPTVDEVEEAIPFYMRYRPELTQNLNSELVAISSSNVDVVEEPEPLPIPQVIISEIFFDAEGSDEGKEFIKIYNPENFIADISDWSVKTSNKKKNFEDGNQIEPNDFFVIRLNGDPQGEPAADLIWKSGSLKNKADSIFLIYDGDVIDEVSYNIEDYPDFKAGDTLIRENGVLILNKLAPRDPEPDSEQEPEEQEPQEGGDNLLKEVKFYKDPENEAVYLIELHFDKYPFVPGTTDRWKVLVFYKDKDPNGKEYIASADYWLPSSMEELLEISYPYYAGELARHILVLPDTAERFGNSGGIMNHAYDYNKIGNGPIILKTSDAPEFFTIAFYDFLSSGGGTQNFKLVGVSDKYYLIK